MKRARTILTTLIVAFGLATSAHATSPKPSMRDVPEIENILFAAAIAHEVSKKCETLDARMMKGLRMALALRTRANDLGYSDSEIRAYIESDTEKARMRAKGEKYLKSLGVDISKPEDFCTYGHAEVAKNSAVGALLKAN